MKVYAAAFMGPPYYQTREGVRRYAEVLGRHLKREGFRSVVARDGKANRIIGFTYGYTGTAGQWWRDNVAAALSPEAVDRWLSDVFELVELAVLPAYQGQGLGGQLHDLLLEDLPHRTAVLSTLEAESNALRLYNKRGWTVLLQDFIFPNASKSYRIMGFNLRNRRR